MARHTKHDDRSNAQPKVRASISLPPEVHAELERLARLKRVSMAWVLRDAAEKYIAEQKRAAISAP